MTDEPKVKVNKTMTRNASQEVITRTIKAPKGMRRNASVGAIPKAEEVVIDDFEGSYDKIMQLDG